MSGPPTYPAGRAELIHRLHDRQGELILTSPPTEHSEHGAFQLFARQPPSIAPTTPWVLKSRPARSTSSASNAGSST